MRNGFDTRQLKAFADTLRNQQQSWEMFCEETVKELASRLLEKVKKRTPVGKAPEIKKEDRTVKLKNVYGKGRTRGFLTAEGARYMQYWSGYRGGTLRRGWTVGNVEKVGNQYQIEVINPTIYALNIMGHVKSSKNGES